MSCSWWQIPIHSGPLLETNLPSPLLSKRITHPHFPSWPSTIYNNDVNNPGLLDPEHLYTWSFFFHHKEKIKTDSD
jgi:hypothetical protein